jgi:hypothetical protein
MLPLLRICGAICTGQRYRRFPSWFVTLGLGLIASLPTTVIQAQTSRDSQNVRANPELLAQTSSGPDTTEQVKQNLKPGYDSSVAEAETALNAANYEQAIASANQALSQRPGDPKALDLLLRARLRQSAGPFRVPPPINQQTPPPVVPPPTPETKSAAETNTTADSTTQIVPEPEISSTAPAKSKGSKNHEIGISGDFFLGQGNVTMPFGFALATVPGPAFKDITPSVAKPDRNSDYYGGTLSYGYKHAIFLDLAYAQGTSSGNAEVGLSPTNPVPSAFSIKDQWFQAYIRYTFPSLRFTRFGAYLRAGASFVKAKLNDSTVFPGFGLYNQVDNTKDYLGNFGAGINYRIYGTLRFQLGLQLEAEGFYGTRSQNSIEDLPIAELGFQPQTTIHNTLFGGIGRGTVRAQYGFGKSGFLKAFVDGGMQGKFTEIKYPSAGSFDGGSFNEILWGPYVKLGLRFSF